MEEVRMQVTSRSLIGDENPRKLVHHRRIGFVFALVLAVMPFHAMAEGASEGTTSSVPTISPEDAGMSSERLERIDMEMNEYVDRGELAGAAVMIGRKGRVPYLKAFGSADIESMLA